MCSTILTLLIYLSLEANHIERQGGKQGRIIVPVAMDSTQEEALLMMRKLKVQLEEHSLEEYKLLFLGCAHF